MPCANQILGAGLVAFAPETFIPALLVLVSDVGLAAAIFVRRGEPYDFERSFPRARQFKEINDVHRLRTLNCNRAQGFHLSKPLSPSDVTRVLQQELPPLVALLRR